MLAARMGVPLRCPAIFGVRDVGTTRRPRPLARPSTLLQGALRCLSDQTSTVNGSVTVPVIGKDHARGDATYSSTCTARVRHIQTPSIGAAAPPRAASRQRIVGEHSGSGRWPAVRWSSLRSRTAWSARWVCGGAPIPLPAAELAEIEAVKAKPKENVQPSMSARVPTWCGMHLCQPVTAARQR